MKKFTKFVSLALASVLVISSFAGCGSKEESTATNDSQDAAETSESTGADTFKIGGIGPVTGGAAA